MAEAIHCPSCSTRYRLRPERLSPAIRRAKCFTCDGVFPVGDLVARLLAPPSEADLPPIRTLQLDETPGTLTLGDLEGADAEILEKTLVNVPGSLPEAPEAPAPAAHPTPAFPPEITESTLSGYTSARDAIERLFGDAPVPPPSTRTGKDGGAMDMEATLSALEATLGAAPATPSDLPADEELTAAGAPPSAAEAPGTTTVRLTQEDLRAALRAPEPPTVALRASDLVTEAPGHPAALEASTAEASGDLLRLRIGEDVYPGLTMPQLIAWVEEGRILENHLVARQHSENWLEAQKVPGLRPVFERLRRERSGSTPTIDSPVLEIAPKKSLFGGLFSKN